MAGPVLKTLLALSSLLLAVGAQTFTARACPSTIAPKNGAPSVAAGWDVKVVASGLSKPRGIIFDSAGHLLVIQQGRGVSSLELKDEGGSCVTAGRPKDVVVDSTLNHGIQFSADGKTLYASSSEAVYSWNYDSVRASNTSVARPLVQGMRNSGHVTRTLLLSRKANGLLLVSRGSAGNLDDEAEDVDSGHCQIKAFNVTNVTSTPYDFTKDGLRLGWGLRNSVGVAEDPNTGAIYSVENSVDEISREGADIHEDNPGEELNFHGYLNGTEAREQGGNYGYPNCFAAWDVKTIPRNENLQVGTQFAIGEKGNDGMCQNERIAPRLTFSAHTAPLDIKFNEKGTAAWVTFHGSWDRSEAIGYKLSVISFANGFPTEPSNSTTAATDIISNPDLSKCPNGCLRPVGLAWDKEGRLFMSSDSTGEIFVISRSDGSPANTYSPISAMLPSGTSSGAPTTTTSTAGAPVLAVQQNPWAALIAAAMGLPLA